MDRNYKFNEPNKHNNHENNIYNQRPLFQSKENFSNKYQNNHKINYNQNFNFKNNLQNDGISGYDPIHLRNENYQINQQYHKNHYNSAYGNFFINNNNNIRFNERKIDNLNNYGLINDDINKNKNNNKNNNIIHKNNSTKYINNYTLNNQNLKNDLNSNRNNIHNYNKFNDTNGYNNYLINRSPQYNNRDIPILKMIDNNNQSLNYNLRNDDYRTRNFIEKNNFENRNNNKNALNNFNNPRINDKPVKKSNDIDSISINKYHYFYLTPNDKSKFYLHNIYPKNNYQNKSNKPNEIKRSNDNLFPAPITSTETKNHNRCKYYLKNDNNNNSPIKNYKYDNHVKQNYFINNTNIQNKRFENENYHTIDHFMPHYTPITQFNRYNDRASLEFKANNNIQNKNIPNNIIQEKIKISSEHNQIQKKENESIKRNNFIHTTWKIDNFSNNNMN